MWRDRLLTEITPDDLRAHCGAIVERAATAIQVRDIVKQIYGFANTRLRSMLVKMKQRSLS